MIPIPSGARVWPVMGHTDIRKGFDGLTLIAQETLKRDRILAISSFSAAVAALWTNVFGAMAKGCACSRSDLERGRFLWRSLADGTVTISTTQLSYLLSGVDWRMPQET